MLRVLLKGMRGCDSQRPDRDRSSHKEENFVHRDSQSDAQTNQQRYSCRINASVISFDCLHNVTFH